jgi:hypothetical protein
MHVQRVGHGLDAAGVHLLHLLHQVEDVAPAKS